MLRFFQFFFYCLIPYKKIPKMLKLLKNSNGKWVQLPSQIGLQYLCMHSQKISVLKASVYRALDLIYFVFICRSFPSRYSRMCICLFIFGFLRIFNFWLQSESRYFVGLWCHSTRGYDWSYRNGCENCVYLSDPTFLW